MSPREDVTRIVMRHLVTELGEPSIASELAAAPCDCGLAWTAPTVAQPHLQSIIAFTFGNRMLPNGNRAPGPVNEQLADAAALLHGVSGGRIFAQWETAEAIGSRVPAEAVTAIYPAQDERVEPVYFSTSGVVAQIARQWNPAALGTVGVVASADHLFRCVETLRRPGFAAPGPEGMVMPREYDPLSGQPWCRSRLAYLLHDVMLRVTQRREAELASGPT